MKKPFIGRWCGVILLLGLLFTGGTALAEGTIRANVTYSNGCPYYIMVNRSQNTVTVYGLDENNYYTVPLRAMVCSTARAGRVTPAGTFALTGAKNRWNLMVDGTYGQYACQFYGNYLFHSICYYAPNPAAMITEEYNLLGSPASLGCVRLQTADARWIYENCAGGTLVTVYDSPDPGPLGKPEKKEPWISPEAANGWDPTDPTEGNPWNYVPVEFFELAENEVLLEAGTAYALTLTILPEEAAAKAPVTWETDDPGVAMAGPDGTLLAIGEGDTVITASCGGIVDQCTVHVTGQLLSYADIPVGAWYYAPVRYVTEHGLFSTANTMYFYPEDSMTLAAAAEALYRLAREEKDVVSDDAADWYPELMWSVNSGLTAGMEAQPGGFGQAMTRRTLSEMLYRYATVYQGTVTEEDPVLWAMGNGLLTAGDPADTVVTRAEAAVIFQRYAEMHALAAAALDLQLTGIE